VEIPVQRLPAETLQALLEEFASRDGTDYGIQETALPRRVEQLRAQLVSGNLQLLFDSDNEQWDLLPKEQAIEILEGNS